MKKFFFSLLVLSLLCLVNTSATYAVDPVGDPKSWMNGLSASGVIDPSKVSIRDDVLPFIIGLLQVGIFLASLLFLIIGGIKWSMGGGTKDGVAKAKATITYALIGLSLSLVSVLIFKALEIFLGAKVFGG